MKVKNLGRKAIPAYEQPIRFISRAGMNSSLYASTQSDKGF